MQKILWLGLFAVLSLAEAKPVTFILQPSLVLGEGLKPTQFVIDAPDGYALAKDYRGILLRKGDKWIPSIYLDLQSEVATIIFDNEKTIKLPSSYPKKEVFADFGESIFIYRPIDLKKNMYLKCGISAKDKATREMLIKACRSVKLK